MTLPLPNPEDKVVEAQYVAPPIDPAGVKRRDRQKFILYLLLVVVSLVVAKVLGFLPEGFILKEVRSPLITMTLLLVLGFVDEIFDQKELAILGAVSEIQQLTKRLEESGVRVARFFDVQPKPQIGTTGLNRKAAFSSKDGEVTISANAVALLNEEELDFIVGHELAHTKRKDIRLYHFIKPLQHLLLLAILLATYLVLQGAVPWAFLSLALLSYGLLLAVGAGRRSQALACDRMAFETLKNRTAALSALRKIEAATVNTGALKMETMTYPAIKKRIEALQNLAL